MDLQSQVNIWRDNSYRHGSKAGSMSASEIDMSKRSKDNLQYNIRKLQSPISCELMPILKESASTAYVRKHIVDLLLQEVTEMTLDDLHNMSEELENMIIESYEQGFRDALRNAFEDKLRQAERSIN